jgi:hypothetical protein
MLTIIINPIEHLSLSLKHFLLKRFCGDTYTSEPSSSGHSDLSGFSLDFDLLDSEGLLNRKLVAITIMITG